MRSAAAALSTCVVIEQTDYGDDVASMAWNLHAIERLDFDFHTGTAVVNQTLSMDAIIEEITEELFTDEVQSMSMTSMSLL